MKGRPPIGTAHQLSFTVSSEHTIDFAQDGMPAVLATPRLIGLLERTAREALSPFLEPEERSVGVEIELRHLAPTPLQFGVTCSVRVIAVDGATVTFQLEARDQQELIARGLHKRAVVGIGRFARRVEAKRSSK
ncbi:MAG: thioesterase family protein [Verrucomicrobiota bacterium]